jgi:uncharacterized protein YhbP (UPF0306 family)
LPAPTSRHCLNLEKNPRVAATVQADYSDWRDIQGVQLEGVAIHISSREEKHARRLYGQKFPVVESLASAPAAILLALTKVKWYKVIPHRLYFIDILIKLGHHDEIELFLSQESVLVQRELENPTV